jgi:uncharacterized protein Veg
MTYNVKISVRKIGAIGVFYPELFVVEAKTAEEAKALAWEKASEQYEIHHVIIVQAT